MQLAIKYISRNKQIAFYMVLFRDTDLWIYQQTNDVVLLSSNKGFSLTTMLLSQLQDILNDHNIKSRMVSAITASFSIVFVVINSDPFKTAF